MVIAPEEIEAGGVEKQPSTTTPPRKRLKASASTMMLIRQVIIQAEMEACGYPEEDIELCGVLGEMEKLSKPGEEIDNNNDKAPSTQLDSAQKEQEEVEEDEEGQEKEGEEDDFANDTASEGSAEEKYEGDQENQEDTLPSSSRSSPLSSRAVIPEGKGAMQACGKS